MLDAERERLLHVIQNHESVHERVEHPIELVLLFSERSHVVEVQAVGEVLVSLEGRYQVFLVDLLGGSAEFGPLAVQRLHVQFEVEVLEELGIVVDTDVDEDLLCALEVPQVELLSAGLINLDKIACVDHRYLLLVL